MITPEIKHKVIAGLADKRELFSGADKQFALSIGIDKAQYNRIKNGETERVLSEGKWITLARLCNVQVGNALVWNTARTPMYTYIIEQLAFCHKHAASRQLCDIPDIGKTHTAKEYADNNKNCVYIDCSQAKSKRKLIKAIAKGFGIDTTGKYDDIYSDLVYYIRQMAEPAMIILDEAGDLTAEADLEVKALWNALEGYCAWYKMGADGFKKKFDRRIASKAVGFTENKSRFGNDFQRVSPDSEIELKQFKGLHAAMIIKANFPDNTDINRVIAKAGFTLRNLKDERRKLSA